MRQLAQGVGRRGWALESAMARMCREGGPQLMTNVLVRDLGLDVRGQVDARRLAGNRCGWPPTVWRRSACH